MEPQGKDTQGVVERRVLGHGDARVGRVPSVWLLTRLDLDSRSHSVRKCKQW